MSMRNLGEWVSECDGCGAPALVTVSEEERRAMKIFCEVCVASGAFEDEEEPKKTADAPPPRAESEGDPDDGPLPEPPLPDESEGELLV